MFAKQKKKKWPIIFVILLLLMMVLAGLFVWFSRSLTLSLKVQGDRFITLEYGPTYLDAGAQAVLQSKFLPDISLPVKVQSVQTVQSNQIGTYAVVYRANLLWMEAVDVRIVQVVDTQPPVITLIEDTSDFSATGKESIETGFQAIDHYDGDLSHKVTWKLDDQVLTYTVEDSSGNRAVAQRTLSFDDSIPPQLTLLGSEEETVYLGRPYLEPGYVATDNFDGDMTAQVVVTGTVDTLTKGVYPITYSVTDTFGNSATVQRTVTVDAAPQPETVVPEGKVIYLTFDDGPSKYTEKLLAILQKYNVKATFFVVNTSYIHLLPEIAAQGHTIGVHTGSHIYREIYASEEAFFRDFKGMHNDILQRTGVSTTLMRFPGGSSNQVSSFNPGIMTRLTKLVTEYGLQYFDWNVDSMDATYAKTTQEIYENVISGIQKQRCSVVLQHDLYEHSVDAVELIIQWGLENGYRFLPLEPSSPTYHQPICN